jgi:SagB-type dehydrogenase family enzyme
LKRKSTLKFFYTIFFLAGSSLALTFAQGVAPVKIKLKPANLKAPLHVLLDERSSCRHFQNRTLDLDTLGALLWATCGKKFDVTTAATRTIPSAGATNPLELYVLIGKDGVVRLKEGLYHYLIEEHALELTAEGDKRQQLAAACLGQAFLSSAPVSLIICAQFERTTRRYGDRGERYVYMEAGSACQNTYLAVAQLGLGTVAVGAFMDERVSAVLGLEEDLVPLIVMPIGYPK